MKDAEVATKEFTTLEVLEMATIINMFSAMIDESLKLNNELLVLHNSTIKPMSKNHVESINKWIDDYGVLKTKLEILNSGVTKH